ncbi:MAG: hypothetical protein CRN43_07610 [Candidatus Nephrothrix sp. EaCA]|nr:MAG: hypothetical protein CRN43_07610 [Candidatus Nephrothrix sp. EaCA]
MASNFKIESMGLFLLNNDANITKKIHSSGLVGQTAIWARNSAVYMPSAPQKLMPLNGLTNEFFGGNAESAVYFLRIRVYFYWVGKIKKEKCL